MGSWYESELFFGSGDETTLSGDEEEEDDIEEEEGVENEQELGDLLEAAAHLSSADGPNAWQSKVSGGKVGRFRTVDNDWFMVRGTKEPLFESVEIDGGYNS